MKIKSVRCIEYDLIDALRRAKVTVLDGDCITDIAADLIEKLECQNATLRELISEIVESKTAFQTQWDKDATVALEQGKSENEGTE
jgi:hypothetical protein